MADEDRKAYWRWMQRRHRAKKKPEYVAACAESDQLTRDLADLETRKFHIDRLIDLYDRLKIQPNS